jgi:amino acid adenylation domain-containing protein
MGDRMQLSIKDNSTIKLIDRQREIQNRCYHPLGGFETFERKDIEQSIPSRFEQMVDKYPDRLAVKTDEQELTYSQLNQIANHIARAIRAGYAEQDGPVVLLIEHGLMMICGIMAVLKADKAYVPLDPLYPHARNSHIMSDSQAGLMVTNAKNLDYAKELTQLQIPIINIDELEMDQPAANLDLFISPDQIAYILYTSGSTGEPKGVYQNHRNLLHDIMQYTNTLHISHNDRMTLLYSFNVNGSLRGTFGAILNGAALFTYDIKAKGLNGLADWLRQEKITFFHSVPTVFRHFMDTLKSDEHFPDVRVIRFGGERVPVSNVEFYKKHFSPECILYTGMGLTEASTVRQYFTDKETEITESVVPAGFAVDERDILLLDDSGREVEPGEVGQIAVKSRYLALGYWRNSELTSKVFLPAPNDEKARIYLTGDLGRILPDGQLIHMGRKDTQVKVRGHRVETAEVEAALLNHPQVKEAAVVAWPDAHGDNFLAAYTVPHKENPPTISELYHFLRKKLPDYMIPAAFVSLEAMPLTANSKVNRRALPRPEKVRPELGTEYVAPLTEVEKSLTEIWSEILGIKQIGVQDNFFELGGHSLTAAQVMSRIRDQFEVELPLRALFETPTVSHLADLVFENKVKKTKVSSITTVARGDEGLPLSFAQHRIWFLDKLDPNSSAYHILAAHRLSGRLDATALEQSFNQVIQRHEVLRTKFIVVDHEPRQVIDPALNIPLTVFDLSKLPKPEKNKEVAQHVSQLQHQPFDLSKDALIRTSLLCLGQEEHVLVVVVHHIVSDAWSMNILFRELSQYYDAYSTGETASLPELPIQYADFAAWQRNWLQGEVLQSQITYWKQQLSESPSFLSLPSDNPRPAVQTFRGGQYSLELPKDVSKALQVLSRQENTTLFMILLTAFKLLIYRHTRQDGVVIGTPIANRNRIETEGLIGFFISTLVLYTPFKENFTFRELLAHEREIVLGAYDYQDIPFEKLVEELRPERDLSHTPLFQIFFNMTNDELNRLHLKGLDVESIALLERESKFDMTLYANEIAGDIRFKLVYNADLFHKERMTEILEQFKVLLAQIVEMPNRPILSYSLITPTARTLLPDPAIDLDEPRMELVTEMFDKWVKESPSSQAIRHGRQVFTYAELAEKAQAIAHILRAKDLEKGQVVAVYGQRSIGLIASMFGVFIAGGVLVSIDPALPEQRKQVMLQEAAVKAFVSVGEELEDISWLDPDSAMKKIFVDANIGNPSGSESGLDLESVSLPNCCSEDPAYIFFTSGTTGIPKGVLGQHKGLSHFLKWQLEMFSVGPQDRSAQLTGLSFDVVLRDIFMPLTSGATLCLPENSGNLGIDRTLEWLKRERITVLHSVPTVAQTWLNFMPASLSLPDLRLTFFAGEPLTDILIQQWRKHFPNAEIVNLYGPTETTLAKCYFRVPAEPKPGVQPVGTPLPETQALVLTPEMQQCGTGEIGEIVIRTPFRTLGYINAREESAKKFIRNPFRNGEKDLIYYTGDRGRVRMDGLLEILGRLDQQVKLRGVRIEPGEVTAALARHPAIDACVVIARQDNQPETYLAAYVVLASQKNATVTELRTFLEQRLLAAMVPRVFVFLDELPKNPNGKVNRRALPIPDLTDQSGDKFMAPRDELELQIAKIWEKVLSVRPIGIRDNFFDMGGHSLLAVHLFAQIHKVTGHDLPLATLFQAPTIEKMTDLIRNQGWKPAWSSLVPIQPQGSKPPLFCIHAVGGNVLSLRDLARHMGKDQPFYALQSQGLNGKEVPPSRVEEMARYYIDEIQTIQPEGPYYLAGQSSGGIVAFEMAQQLIAQGHTISLLALIDTFEPDTMKSVSIKRADRLAFHKKNLAEEGLPYLFGQLSARWKRFVRRQIGKISREMQVVYQKLGKPVPPRFRHIVIRGIVRKATRKYTPKTYPGHIILFRAVNTIRSFVEDRKGVRRGWEKLADGGLEIVDINGAHNLEQEPYVGTLAEHLNRYIAEAQAKY